MRYISTRGAWAANPQTFSAILLEGLAPDGGLAVPQQYPRLTREELMAWRTHGYRELAFAVLSRFVDDIPAADLRRIIDKTYTREIFGDDAITPLLSLEPGFDLLRVSGGPTLAFKDIALQLLGNLFEYALAREGRTINILGATSGDTGSSAEYAMRGKRGIAVFMLSPKGRMSPFQTAQMFSLQDPNIFNVAIEGTFDDCQDLVKALNGDAAFKARYRLGAVNSINWARIAAQVVYYFKGYYAATTKNLELVDFAVPSGNFGNILAAHVAREMGLPIRRLILATNENDVLDEFFRTGRYRPRSVGRDARDLVAVDGHLEGVQLRAVHLRRGGPRRVDAARAVRPARRRRRLLPHRHAALGARAGRQFRVRTQHARRPPGHDPRRARPLRARRRPAHGRRHQGGARSPRSVGAADLRRDRAARQVRRHDPRGAGPRTGASRRSTPGSKAGRSAARRCRRTRSA